MLFIVPKIEHVIRLKPLTLTYFMGQATQFQQNALKFEAVNLLKYEDRAPECL